MKGGKRLCTMKEKLPNESSETSINTKKRTARRIWKLSEAKIKIVKSDISFIKVVLLLNI